MNDEKTPSEAKLLRDKPPAKKRYIAKAGMNLGDLKGKRIEKGDVLPEGLKPATIKDLLAGGDIEEI